jgi:release factor glutamine methyltransferase
MTYTYAEAIRFAQDLIGRRDSLFLLSHLTGKDRSHFFIESSTRLNTDEHDAFMDKVARRAHGEPLQYILGTWSFYGYDFLCDARALIPRNETERLVETALAFLFQFPMRAKGQTVLDLCTGGGCIAVTLAILTDAQIIASDLSSDALALAIENAKKNGVSERIHFTQSDLFNNICPRQPFSLIISNPPYIPTADIDGLQFEVRSHEPRTALDGGPDGLDFYRKIIPTGREYLSPGGMLMLEVGAAKEVAALMDAAGYEKINILNDYAEKPRVVTGTR